MIIEELVMLNSDGISDQIKKKSEILIKEAVEEVKAIRCMKTVKYVGVKLTCSVIGKSR
jgi:hypothetical protein